MHKQELINKYTDRLNGVLNLGALEIFNDLINDLKKLDEPESRSSAVCGGNYRVLQRTERYII